MRLPSEEMKKLPLLALLIKLSLLSARLDGKFDLTGK
jgi:hypothetical protein